jgi:hypothetical protein
MVFGRVFTIRSHQTTDIYIGSTKQILCKRMSDHWRDYRRYLNKNIKYLTSFELLKFADAYIELIYEGEFESQNALERKEGEYQREMDCVNKVIAGRTQKEYYEENKQQILEQIKEYREINKEEIKEKRIQYYQEHREEILEQKHEYNEAHKDEKHEYNQKYYKENTEQIIIKGKQYYDENKAKIIEKKKIKIECCCGSIYRGGERARHEKTKKHQLFLQNKV